MIELRLTHGIVSESIIRYWLKNHQWKLSRSRPKNHQRKQTSQVTHGIISEYNPLLTQESLTKLSHCRPRNHQRKLCHYRFRYHQQQLSPLWFYFSPRLSIRFMLCFPLTTYPNLAEHGTSLITSKLSQVIKQHTTKSQYVHFPKVPLIITSRPTPRVATLIHFMFSIASWQYTNTNW
jgi:hypothetical protein